MIVARVEQVIRIVARLNRSHQSPLLGTELHSRNADFAVTHAVLACTVPPTSNRAAQRAAR